MKTLRFEREDVYESLRIDSEDFEKMTIPYLITAILKHFDLWTKDMEASLYTFLRDALDEYLKEDYVEDKFFYIDSLNCDYGMEMMGEYEENEFTGYLIVNLFRINPIVEDEE